MPFYFWILLLVWNLVALGVFLLLFFVTAPYGRHERAGWGLRVPNRWGWIGMEVVSPLVFAYFFWAGQSPKTWPVLVFFALWVGHYFNRSLIFPFRLKTQGKTMPLSIVLSAVFFNSVNGFLNGHFLGHLAHYPVAWGSDIRFWAGLGLFLVGMAVNVHADEVLLRLRKPGQTDYQIPQGGLYRWVSSPNYLGEMMEWLGFALMTWSWPGLTFALWTVANLAPRAWANHCWYQQKFREYPAQRRALLPFIW
ncbi:MAG: DUF1295 domain-containing protein [Microscillaceae bacterium]|nr:DUF1295 domain-containing protein [Microscillaceae bacterium]